MTRTIAPGTSGRLEIEKRGKVTAYGGLTLAHKLINGLMTALSQHAACRARRTHKKGGASPLRLQLPASLEDRQKLMNLSWPLV